MSSLIRLDLAHEQAIRNQLCDLPIEIDVWRFNDAKCELDLAIKHSEDIDSSAISAAIYDCFFSYPSFGISAMWVELRIDFYTACYGTAPMYCLVIHFFDEEQQPVLTFELSLPAGTRDDNVSIQVQTIKQFLAGLEANFKRICTAVCDELLETHNSHWNVGSQSSQEEFRAEMSIQSVSCGSGRWICCCLNAGELFTDHVIEVRVDPGGAIQSVTLAG